MKGLNSSMIELVTDALGKKGKGKGVVFKLACLLIEARDKSTHFSAVSYNVKSKQGIRVTRENGRDEIRSIANTVFESNKEKILAHVLRAVDTELSHSIAKILEKDVLTVTKITSLGKIKVSVAESSVGHFTAELVDTRVPMSVANEYMQSSSDRASSSSSTNSSFVFKQFGSDGAETSSQRVTWSTTHDQNLAVSLFFSTMEDKTLKGLVNNSTNIEYLAKLCDVLYNTMDPAKLSSRLKLRREDDGADTEDDGGEGDSEEADPEDKGIDFSDGSQVRNVFLEEVESELDPILFQIGGKEEKGAARKSSRIRNCLATMRQVGGIFGQTYGFSFLGSHVGQVYAQMHLKLKFQTEIKSFLTCGNSPRRFTSFYSYP